VNTLFDTISERAVILAPQGRDAQVAAKLLREGGLTAEVCDNLRTFTEEIAQGAGVAVLTDDAIRNADIKILAAWISSQPSWSDFPFVDDRSGRGAGANSRCNETHGGARQCGVS